MLASQIAVVAENRSIAGPRVVVARAARIAVDLQPGNEHPLDPLNQTISQRIRQVGGEAPDQIIYLASNWRDRLFLRQRHGASVGGGWLQPVQPIDLNMYAA